tara:strand:- start:413 stop:892 length:480 start_codon:yes stop_codon:yes gene_type:complete
MYVQTRLAKKIVLFGHLFFNITNVLCAKKRVGHACMLYMPHDGHLLASFKIIPPKVRVSRQKCHFLIILILHGWMRTRIFENNLRHNFCFFFFGCFCRKFCHADLDSREQQAILRSKKWKISGQNSSNCFCVCFPASFLARFCHAVRLEFREHQGFPPD